MMKMNEIQYRLLKEELKPCYIIIFLVICLAALVSVGYVMGNDSGIDLITVLIFNLVIFSLTFLILYFLNKELYRDIKSKEVEEIKKVILEKNKKTDYEPGSGNLFVPILGNLFPKIWGRKMKEVYIYELIIEKKSIKVEEDIYNNLQVGDEITLTYARYSKTFLGMRKTETPSCF